MKKSLLLIISSLLLAGCNIFFPEPASLIQAPKSIQMLNNADENMYEIAKTFLPTNMSLTAPNEPVGLNSVITADFNNDGIDEAVAFYKSNRTADKVGAIVLQKKIDQWREVTTFYGSGYEISWGSTTDMTGDGIPELLLGWKVGVAAGNLLDIYSWKDGKFMKIAQHHFHEFELISDEDLYRLVLWKRELEGGYEIDILKWQEDSFISDKTLSPSYFRTVANYYQQRVESVPDAAYYWYYLSEALLRSDQPEAALTAINTGIEKNIVLPTYDDFMKLRKDIENKIASQSNQDVQYYVPNANLTMNIPRSLASNILIQEKEGLKNEYIVNVLVTDGKNQTPLFSIEIYSKDFLTTPPPLPVNFETEHLIYSIRMMNQDQSNSPLYEISKQSALFLDEILDSVRLGPSFQKHINLEDELLINIVVEAYSKYLYISMGGEIKSGLIQSFLYQDRDYRYLGEDVNSREKLTDYLSSSFTDDAIEAFLEISQIIEHNGKLAQPNADGGSLLNYSEATVLQVKDLGSEIQYNLKVPLLNSLTYEVVPVVFRKTEQGWRISSNPLIL